MLEHYASQSLVLSGAEAVALILRKERVKNVFVYPGTSELALCEAILKTPNLRLINGRGDKESAFMAAGGCLISPVTSVAVLHGARGLTNAAGAIADANRNEIGTVFFVGLPSTTSSSYLPPHGERNLIKSIGNFVKAYYEIKKVVHPSDTSSEAKQKAVAFVELVTKAIWKARSLPMGPTLIGIPQDAFEKRWIPYEFLTSLKKGFQFFYPSDFKIRNVIQFLEEKKHPIILVDDFLFKNPQAKKQLVLFAKAIGAPVFQVHYRRGAMLFEKVSLDQNPYFVGFYNPHNTWHQKLIKKADLILTLEDRNMYPRVIGLLPKCQKIALTSNPRITKKNGYLRKGDILVAGDVTKMMQSIMEILSTKHHLRKKDKVLQKLCRDIREKSKEKIITDSKYDFMRKGVADELGKIFEKCNKPILVDDSQMFGGVLSESYDRFPSHLRVFGDHGGFVGAGIAYSAGLALSSPQSTVFCTLGDYAFANGFQGFVAMVQENIKVIYLVCNNKTSVSLIKQSAAQGIFTFHHENISFLDNAPHLNYCNVAEALGLSTFRVMFDPERSKPNTTHLKKMFRKYLLKALKTSSPVLIELAVPSNLKAWQGIWSVKGNEEIKKVSAHRV